MYSFKTLLNHWLFLFVTNMLHGHKYNKNLTNTLQDGYVFYKKSK